jgi:hypothetical protein
MVPETFYCTKEKNPNRKIQQLEHESRIITDQEKIIQIIQQWYEGAAERAMPQTLSLPDFLAAHEIHLPQISDDHKEMWEEEFTNTNLPNLLANLLTNFRSNIIATSLKTGGFIDLLHRLKYVYSLGIVSLHCSKLADFEAIQSFHWLIHVYRNGIVSLHWSKVADLKAIQSLHRRKYFFKK